MPIESKTPGTGPSSVPNYQQLILESRLKRQREDQNLGAGLIAGIVAAAIGATAWAVVTALTEFQIGFMAVGVGFLVGWSIRQFGKGVDQIFGIAAAVLSLLGCVAGNLLSSCIFIANQTNEPIASVLGRVNVDIAIEIMKATFSPMDLLFYGLALYFGYKYSLRLATESTEPAKIG